MVWSNCTTAYRTPSPNGAERNANESLSPEHAVEHLACSRQRPVESSAAAAAEAAR